MPDGWRWPDDGRWACHLRQDAQHAGSKAAGHRAARRGLGRTSGIARADAAQRLPGASHKGRQRAGSVRQGLRGEATIAMASLRCGE
jgi:hypothetical protein